MSCISSLRIQLVGESSTPTGLDPIAMMEYYMKKAAAEEMRRPPKASKDEMPPPASLQGCLLKTLYSLCDPLCSMQSSIGHISPPIFTLMASYKNASCSSCGERASHG